MIRQLLLNDLEVVSGMYQDANPSCSQSDILHWTTKGLRAFPSYNFVYIMDDEIVGAVSGILKTKNTAMINDIVILHQYRNNKIGAALIAHLMEKFKQDNIKKVLLCVGWKNSRAIPFYYRHGFRFKKIGQVDDEDAIYMEKIL